MDWYAQLQRPCPSAESAPPSATATIEAVEEILMTLAGSRLVAFFSRSGVRLRRERR